MVQCNIILTTSDFKLCISLFFSKSIFMLKCILSLNEIYIFAHIAAVRFSVQAKDLYLFYDALKSLVYFELILLVNGVTV